MAKQKGLGKGVSALFGDFAEPLEETSGYKVLPLYKIEPNPEQPRQDFDPEELQSLSESIATHGLIQPLIVRLLDSGYYQIIAGERRWRACRMAGLSEVPTIVMEADDRKAMALALIENLQRQDLNPMEESLGYQRLMQEFGLTQEEAAHQVGKSRSAVANSLRLLNLSEPVMELVRSGKLTAGHASHSHGEIREKAGGSRPEDHRPGPFRPPGGAALPEYVPGNRGRTPACKKAGSQLHCRMRKEPVPAAWPRREDRQRQTQGPV